MLTSQSLRLTGRGYVVLLRKLMDAGADVNAVDLCGKTPLIAAVEHRRLDFVRYLLEEKANVNHVCRDGTNALWHASTYDSVKRLLEYRIDSNHRSFVGKGNCLLHHCSVKPEFAQITAGSVQWGELGANSFKKVDFKGKQAHSDEIYKIVELLGTVAKTDILVGCLSSVGNFTRHTQT